MIQSWREATLNSIMQGRVFKPQGRRNFHEILVPLLPICVRVVLTSTLCGCHSHFCIKLFEMFRLSTKFAQNMIASHELKNALLWYYWSDEERKREEKKKIIERRVSCSHPTQVPSIRATARDGYLVVYVEGMWPLFLCRIVYMVITTFANHNRSHGPNRHQSRKSSKVVHTIYAICTSPLV